MLYDALFQSMGQMDVAEFQGKMASKSEDNVRIPNPNVSLLLSAVLSTATQSGFRCHLLTNIYFCSYNFLNKSELCFSIVHYIYNMYKHRITFVAGIFLVG